MTNKGASVGCTLCYENAVNAVRSVNKNAKVYKNSRANLLGYFIGLNVITSTFVGGFDDPRSSKRPNRSSL